MRTAGLLSTALALGLGLGLPALADDAPSTLGAKPPGGAIVLFDGKDLAAWAKRDGSPAGWSVENGIVTIVPNQGDIRTKDAFGSYKLHLEFNTPYMPDATGQARGNSGVYQQGRYELQVLDSYGLEPKDNECGGIYKQVVPKVNACKPPLQWQTYDITFHAARCSDGKSSEKARITVVQNGKLIIDDAAIEPTPGGLDDDPCKDGPILLQDHHNAVQYRNIWLEKIEK